MKIQEQIPKSFVQCPSCNTLKHASLFAESLSYVPPLSYCDQCLDYISEVYSEYNDSILKHTGKIPLSPNEDKASNDLFMEYRKFSHVLDHSALSINYGVKTLPATSLLRDAPENIESDKPVIATFVETGQIIEFSSPKLAAYYLNDNALFIHSQCLINSFSEVDSIISSELTEAEKELSEPSKKSGYIYVFKHRPSNILSLAAAEKKHVELFADAVDLDIKKEDIQIDDDIIEDNLIDLEEDIDLNNLFFGGGDFSEN